MARVTESDVIVGRPDRRPRRPRRRAGLLRRDLPARVVPAGPGDGPGQPRRPPGRRRRRAALPPAPGRLLVRPLRHRPGGAPRPARRARPPTAPRSALDLGRAGRRHPVAPGRVHPAGRGPRLRGAHRHDHHLPGRRLLQPGRRARRGVGRPGDRGRLGRHRPDPVGPRPGQPAPAPTSSRSGSRTLACAPDALRPIGPERPVSRGPADWHEAVRHRRAPGSSARTTSATCSPPPTTRSRSSTRSPTPATSRTCATSTTTRGTASCRATSATARPSPPPWPATTRSCTSPPRATSTARSSTPTSSCAPTATAPT